MDDVKAYPPYLDYPKPRKTTTNADRIRAMSDEELAKLFDSDDVICPPNHIDCTEKCTECFLKWLQQPAERG